jgi:DNA-binding transcriptional ArsR family regulator
MASARRIRHRTTSDNSFSCSYSDRVSTASTTRVDAAAGHGGTLTLAVSPMWELVTSLRTVLRSSGGPVHARWRHHVAPRLDDLNLAMLPALVEAPIVPHFLQPPPARDSTFESELSRIAALRPEQIITELGYAFGDAGRRDDPAAVVPKVLLPLITRPATAIERLAAELQAYWTAALAPNWPRLEDFLLADVERMGKRVPFAAATSLNPAYSLADDQLKVANMHFAGAAVPGAAEGWLVASVFSWPHDNSILCNVPGIAWPDRAPMLPYVPRGFANLWRDDRLQGDDALASVLGPTRAKIVSMLVRPTSTAEVANALAITPGGASQQLMLLHRAGLAERSRDGHLVYYRLSRRGRGLLGFFADVDT